ncbi:BAH_G0048560.mRNA.1.CDS.1 [Saccharomyces cerevisiae]|nr:hypothetical protein H823_YJM1447O00182 [Saccharomyces cerevisiae YJM1447]CAD6645151.1 HN1_G0037880.mRNA.1.CDS.1 [Saccharomyces cerevisiae]CAD6648031.1 SX2_G0032660.mRNA.1.CDS.1 [Saccharomyces cerevisiae]CAI4704555.1 BMC_2a_G0049460.mRNA.1.CDS.1 [Saccharomyces cerevisiae]CAI4711856.1 BMB_G0049420.mRNA.1.CDS.1 [Saccharomyces cerevisiae]
MGAAYKVFGKTVQPHVLAISTFIATAAVASYFTTKPKTKTEGKNSSALSQQKSGESSNSDAMGKDDDVVKNIEGFLNDLEKDTRQDTKAN